MAEKIESVQTFGRKVSYSLDLVEFCFFFLVGVDPRVPRGHKRVLGVSPAQPSQSGYVGGLIVPSFGPNLTWLPFFSPSILLSPLSH